VRAGEIILPNEVDWLESTRDLRQVTLTAAQPLLR
jgi:hypothetical protein